MPGVARACSGIDAFQAMLDGELVVMSPQGRPNFSALQAAMSDGAAAHLTFHAFDLLHLDGWDLRPCPLLDRKRLLRSLCDWSGPLR